jgi:hypothetical protein
MRRKELAALIARAVFEDGTGRIATRIEHKHKRADGKEIAGAGWCEKALADRIERLLSDEFPIELPATASR